LFFGSVVIATAQSLKSEINAISASVHAKIKKGTITAADLAPELNQYSDLLAQHAGEKTDEVAEILLTQAMVYADVIGDHEMGIVLLKRLKYEFPKTETGKSVDPLIASIKSGERYKNRRLKTEGP
jgi:hypothetical protein